MKLRKLWNSLNIKKKVLSFFLPLNILSVLLILILSISLIIQNGKKEMMQNTMEKLILVCDQTDRIISNIKYNIKAFSTSSTLQTAICTNYPDNNYGNYLFSSAMHASVYNIMDIGSLIYSGYIQTYDGKVFNIKTDEITSPTEEMNKLYDEITSKHGQLIIGMSSDTSGTIAFNISKSLIDINTGTCLGILSFDIKEDLFYDAYKTITDGYNESIFICDTEGRIISSHDRSLLQTHVSPDIWELIKDNKKSSSLLSIDNKRNLLLTQNTQLESFHVIYFTEYYNIYKEALSLALLLILIGFFILIITIFLSQVLAKSLVKPIIQLADYADATGKGNLGVEISVTSNDEIGFLANRFQQMSHNIHDLTNRIYNEQNQKREYELNLMQAQINPHFLYNCLDSISSLVNDNQREVATNMIYHLGCYYRGILSKGQNLITIQEEMQMIRDYLEIQLIKTPSLFTYSIRIEEDLKQFKILKMLIQPIVENTIIHGFVGYTDKGNIIIDVTSLKNVVTITVTDDGRGISQSTMSNLFAPNHISVPKHFGLQNVHNRIRLKYGDAYGLTISSTPNKGTKITVQFPKTY